MKAIQKLRMKFSKSENDMMYFWPGRKGDGNLLHLWINTPLLDGKNIQQILTDRGYDIKTLKFEICPIEPPTPTTKQFTTP